MVTVRIIFLFVLLSPPLAMAIDCEHPKHSHDLSEVGFDWFAHIQNARKCLLSFGIEPGDIGPEVFVYSLVALPDCIVKAEKYSATNEDLAVALFSCLKRHPVVSENDTE